MPDALTVPLTHIAAVYARGQAWRVHAVYPRGQVPTPAPNAFWMFVPAGVKVGDEVLCDPGVTTYADPDWAEWWAAGGTGPGPSPRRR